jgi:hypothetical protein
MFSLATNSNKYFIAARRVNYKERKEASIFVCDDVRIMKSQNTKRLSVKNKQRIQSSNGR